MTRYLKKLALVIALAWAWLANAQSTLETDNPIQLSEPIVFTAHLTGNTSYTGDGTFSLADNVFSYRVVTDLGFDQAGIYGPALPGADGPLIFTLILTYCEAPKPDGTPTYCVFSGRPPGTGAFTLSNEQASDLLSGMWYVQAGAPTAPSFALKGQILQVPEPSAFRLLLTGGAICSIVWGRRLWAKIRSKGSK